MKIYWSYLENKLISNIYSNGSPNTFEFVLRDKIEVLLYIVEPQNVVIQPYKIVELDSYSLKIEGKQTGEYSNNPLFCGYDFVKTGTGTSTFYTCYIRLDNPTLIARMEGDSSSEMNIDDLAVTGEITALPNEDDNVYSTQFPINVVPDVIRLSDVCPTPVEYSSSSSLSSNSSSSLSSVSSYSSLSSISSPSSSSESSLSLSSVSSYSTSSSTSTSSSHSRSSKSSTSQSSVSPSSSSPSSISSSSSSVSSQSSLSSISSSSSSSPSSLSSLSSPSSSSPSSLSSPSSPSSSSPSSPSSSSTWLDIRFRDNGDGTITDTQLDIMWLQDAGAGGTTNWATADSYCSTLNYAGYNDWRLPNAYGELASFPSYPPSTPFTNVQSYYWGETLPTNPLKAYIVNMSNGVVGATGKQNLGSCWPVRDI